MEKNAADTVGELSAVFLPLHNVLQNLETQSLETIRIATIKSLQLAAENYGILQNALDKIEVIKN